MSSQRNDYRQDKSSQICAYRPSTDYTSDLDGSPDDCGVDSQLRKTRVRIRFAGVGAAMSLAALIGSLAIFFPSQFKHQIEISLVRQPTAYTELFFTHPELIPEKLHVDRRTSFEFTIANRGSTTEKYEYIVTMERGKSDSVVAEGRVSVANNQQVTRIISVEPDIRHMRYLVNVVLSGISQSIHFYGVTS